MIFFSVGTDLHSTSTPALIISLILEISSAVTETELVHVVVPSFTFKLPRLICSTASTPFTSRSASAVLSTTINNLYLSVFPDCKTAMASSTDFATNLTPAGAANFRDVALSLSFDTASFTTKIQSAANELVHAKATCPWTNLSSPLTHLIIKNHPPLYSTHLLILD